MKRYLNAAKRAYYNLKLDHKLMIGYAFIVLTPTILLTVLISLYNFNIFSKQRIESIRSEFTGFSSQFNQTLEQLASYRYFFQNNTEISNYLNNDYTTVSDSLYHYIANIHDLFQCYSADDRVSSITLFGLEDYTLTIPEKLESIENFPGGDALFQTVRKKSDGIWRIDEDGNLNYYLVLYHYHYNTIIGIMHLQANADTIFSLLYGTSDTLSAFPFFFFDEASDVWYQCQDNRFVPLTKAEINALHANQNTLLYFPIEKLDWSMCVSVSNPEPSLHHFFLYAAVGFASLLFFSLLYFSVCRSITGRMIAFEHFLGKQTPQKLKTWPQEQYTDEIGNVITAYNQLVERINELIHNNYEVALKMKEARYYALQAQIRPHFFNNILENIRMSSESHNDEETARMTQIFGTYMHYAMNDSMLPSPLEDELRSARNFLEVNKIHLSHQLSYEILVETELEGFFCPRFVFQTILENSIKHGRAQGTPLHICITAKDVRDENGQDAILVQITDNGKGIRPEHLAIIQEILHSAPMPSTRHVGLRNINDRLKSFNQNQQGLIIESPNQQGTIVRFLLLRKEKNHEYSDC